jgi:hypothetical protein
MDVLQAMDSFGIDTKDSNKHMLDAILTICINTLVVFATETLPLQFSLDDAYLSLFTRPLSLRPPAEVEAQKTGGLGKALLQEEQKEGERKTQDQARINPETDTDSR